MKNITREFCKLLYYGRQRDYQHVIQKYTKFLTTLGFYLSFCNYDTKLFFSDYCNHAIKNSPRLSISLQQAITTRGISLFSRLKKDDDRI